MKRRISQTAKRLPKRADVVVISEATTNTLDRFFRATSLASTSQNKELLHRFFHTTSILVQCVIPMLNYYDRVQFLCSCKKLNTLISECCVTIFEDYSDFEVVNHPKQMRRVTFTSWTGKVDSGLSTTPNMAWKSIHSLCLHINKDGDYTIPTEIMVNLRHLALHFFHACDEQVKTFLRRCGGFVTDLTLVCDCHVFSSVVSLEGCDIPDSIRKLTMGPRMMLRTLPKNVDTITYFESVPGIENFLSRTLQSDYCLTSLQYLQFHCYIETIRIQWDQITPNLKSLHAKCSNISARTLPKTVKYLRCRLLFSPECLPVHLVHLSVACSTKELIESHLLSNLKYLRYYPIQSFTLPETVTSLKTDFFHLRNFQFSHSDEHTNSQKKTYLSSLRRLYLTSTEWKADPEGLHSVRQTLISLNMDHIQVYFSKKMNITWKQWLLMQKHRGQYIHASLLKQSEDQTVFFFQAWCTVKNMQSDVLYSRCAVCGIELCHENLSVVAPVRRLTSLVCCHTCVNRPFDSIHNSSSFWYDIKTHRTLPYGTRPRDKK